MQTTPFGYTVDISALPLFAALHLHETGGRTVWVPDIAQELHGRRHERVVLGKLEFRWKHAAFVWGVLRALYESLPDEQIIFRDWAGRDAVWRVGSEVLVLLEEPLRRYRIHDVVYVLSIVRLVSMARRKWNAVRASRRLLQTSARFRFMA